jgi:hypothetical protein
MRLLAICSWGLVLMLIGSAGAIWLVVAIAEGTVR